MISAEFRHMILAGILTFVEMQAVIVLFLAFLTLIMLSSRRRTSKIVQEWNAIHEQQILDEFLSYCDGKPERVLTVQWGNHLKNKSLRDSLLKQIAAISGEERMYFCDRYRELGYVRRDLRFCKSLDWSERLAAILRLAQLNQSDLAPVMNRMRSDSNRIVASTAMYGLSSLEHALNVPDTQRLKLIMLDGRRNLLLAIVANWERIYGFRIVFDACRASPDDGLRNASFIAAVETKDPQAVPFLIELLQSIDQQIKLNLSYEVVAETLRTLREIGDPRALDVARKMVKHPNDSVKIRALDILLLFGDHQDFEQSVLHTRRSSSEVKRVMEEWEQARLAS